MVNKNRRLMLSRISSLSIGIPLALTLVGCAHPSGRRKRRRFTGYTVQSSVPKLRWATRYRQLVVSESILFVGTHIELPDGRIGRIDKVSETLITLNVDNSSSEYQYQLG